MKHYNVKILMTALLCTAFSLTIGAQDFGGENVITTGKSWKVEDSWSTMSSLTNKDGLYVRAAAGKNITVGSSSKNVKYADGTSFTASKVMVLPAISETDFSANKTAGAVDGINGTLALNIGVSGRIHVFTSLRKATSPEDETAGKPYNIRWFFNGEQVGISSGEVPTSSESNIDKDVVYYASSAGTFYLCSDQRVNIYAVKFVPENRASATSLWRFDQFNDGAIIAASSGATSTGKVINVDGLYIHNRDDKALNADSQNATFTFEGTTVSLPKPFKRFQIAYAGSVGTEMAACQKPLGAIALEITTPGTLYFATQHVNDASRYFYLYKNGIQVKSQKHAANTNRVTVSYEAEPGTYYFTTSTGTLNALGVLFVPTTAIPMTREVTLGDTGYATFSASQNYILPEGLTAYVVSSFDKENKKITMVSTDVIPACEGVVLKGTPNTTYTLTSTEEMGSVAKNMLVANLAEWNLSTTSGGNTNFILVPDGAGSVKFAKSSGNAEKPLAANKAYLQVPTGDLSGHELTISFADSETTGIGNLTPGLSQGEGVCFDLQGRKLSGKPTKGLYIVNGKKVIIK